MELDDLKANWQEETDQNLNINKRTMEQLHLILKEKTAGTISQLKKKYERIISFILIGIFLNILLNPFLHFLLGDEGPVFRITFGGLLSLLTIVILCLIVVFFYWIKYKSLDTVIPNSNLKNTIYEKIVNLKNTLKQEIFLISTILLTVLVSARITSQYLGNGDFWDIFHLDILLSLGATICMVGFYIYKRLKAYNKNIQELKGYLDYLKENE